MASKIQAIFDRYTKSVKKVIDFEEENKKVLVKHFELGADKEAEKFTLEEKIDMMFDEGAITEDIELVNETLTLKVKVKNREVRVYENRLFKSADPKKSIPIKE